MLKTEFYMTRIDGVNLYRHYSDKGVMLCQVETDILYPDPIDVEGAPFTYEETDVLIDTHEHQLDEPI
jgi:hypothetical protein